MYLNQRHGERFKLRNIQAEKKVISGRCVEKQVFTHGALKKNANSLPACMAYGSMLTTKMKQNGKHLMEGYINLYLVAKSSTRHIWPVKMAEFVFYSKVNRHAKLSRILRVDWEHRSFFLKYTFLSFLSYSRQCFIGNSLARG